MKNTNVIPIQKIPSMLENDYQFVDLRDPYEYSGAKSKKLADDLCQQGYDAYSIEGGFYSILHQKT